MGNVYGAKLIWPEVFTTRLDGLAEIYEFLQVRRGAARKRLGRQSGRAKGITCARPQGYGLQRAADYREARPPMDGAPQDL